MPPYRNFYSNFEHVLHVFLGFAILTFFCGVFVVGCSTGKYTPTLEHFASPCSVQPLPKSLIETNRSGWIMPDGMEKCVIEAIQNEFGQLDYSRSITPKAIIDHGLLGEALPRYEGQLVTEPSLISEPVLEQLQKQGLNARGMRVSVKVRYWTERWGGTMPPGELYISVSPSVVGVQSSQVKQIDVALAYLFTKRLCDKISKE